MTESVDMPDYSPYQILTPTSTASPDSRMYNWQQFDVGGASTSSPMPPQPAIAQDMMMPYSLDDRRSPDPPQPYHGMYGVSAPDHRDANPYYVGMQMPMEQPMNPAPNHFIKTEQALSPPDVPRSLKPPRKASKTPRRASKSAARKGRLEQEDHRDCLGEEVMPRLKHSCPPEEKCILESRWNHRGKKGHDMWDSIMDDYERTFNKPGVGKEALQMKYKRARLRYYEWLPQDLDILRSAFVELEKNRYEMLLEKFYELGGSRNMHLTAADVEVKVVTDLKLEEGMYMDEHRDVAVRRRKKVSARKGRQNNSPCEDEASRDERPPVNEEHVISQVQSRDWNGHFGTDMSAVQRELGMPLGLISEQQARNNIRNGSHSYRRR